MTVRQRLMLTFSLGNVCRAVVLVLVFKPYAEAAFAIAGALV